MATRPADELAARRARRDALPAAALDAGPVGVEHLRARLAAAEHEVAALQGRLGRTTAERDCIGALAATRRSDWLAAGRRERAVRAELGRVERELADTRERLAGRTTSEARLRVEATGLHARIHALRAAAAAHDARVAELGALVEELSGDAEAARAEADRGRSARDHAESALDTALTRIGDLEDEVTALRTELHTLHDARDRTLTAEAGIRAARTSERDALRRSGERLRPRAAGDVAEIPDLGAELARAAERLRSQAPVASGEEPVPRPALVPAVSPLVPAVAPAPPPRVAAAAVVGRIVRGLRGRRR